MINITQYFKDNYDENDYYGYSFFYLKFLDDIPEYVYYDEEELIVDFKDMLDPVHEKEITIRKEDKFILMCFYFYKNGYIIEQFPKLFERPHKEKCYPDFMIKQIREYIMKERSDFSKKVSWEERRRLISNLKFIKNEMYDKDIEKIIKNITTGNSSFSDMKIDEKLMNIANAIEYLLKENNKYISIEFNNVKDIINDEKIKGFKHKFQCFRHSSKESIKERNNYSEKEKKTMIEYGIFIIKTMIQYI